MPSSSFALQKAFFLKLAADGALAALLGGPRIYDDVPVRGEFPYVTFGQTTERDWSTGTDNGGEHVVTLHVWSRAAGRKEADEIMDAVRTALHDQVLSLTGHRLVNLRHEFSGARRDADGESYHGVTRYRAVTEVV